MQKTLLFVILLIIISLVISLALFFIVVYSIDINYGNYVELKNELNLDIDSVEMFVCDKKTVFLPYIDSTKQKHFGEKINVEELTKPCDVKFIIYSKDTSMVLKGDTFDCYNCDIDHYYRLTFNRAIYEYTP